MCVLIQTRMPKETVETTTTRLVEKTEKEDIIICDGCGMDESDREIDKFQSEKYDPNLYFCNECLLKDAKDPINSHITFGDRFQQRINTHDRIEAVLAWAAVLNAPFIGAIFGGITGFLIGFLPAIPTILVLHWIENSADSVVDS